MGTGSYKFCVNWYLKKDVVEQKIASDGNLGFSTFLVLSARVWRQRNAREPREWFSLYQYYA